MSRYLFLFMVLFVSSYSYSQTYENMVSKAADYIESKDYYAAEELLKQAMRKEPANQGNFLLLSNLGTIQRELGKNQEALISYNSALSKYPNNIAVLENRAILLCDMDSLNAAMRDYNIILSLDSDNTQALYKRGLIYMSEKNYLAAETDFEQAIKINPNYIPALKGLALSLKSKGEWEEAESKYTDLIYKYKNDPSLYVNRAECYINLKKLARAQTDLQKAEELKYKDALLYIVKGQLSLEQFDKFTAKTNFTKALELGANKDLIDTYLKLCK